MRPVPSRRYSRSSWTTGLPRTTRSERSIAFIDELDLRNLGVESAQPSETGRPTYHPGTNLKIYIYGYYLNRVQSSRRLEREG